MAFGAAFGGMVFAEALRFGLIPPFGYRMDLFMKSFTDNRDLGVVILSHIYLLLGCSSTVWINRLHFYIPSKEIHNFYLIAPFSGVLVLGCADSAVIYSGETLGRDLLFFFLIH